MHPLRPDLLPAEKTFAVMHREHDDDRVGAREMLGLAGQADALVAGLGHGAFRAADRAEAVPVVPVDHRFGLRHDRKFGRRDLAGHGERPQILECAEPLQGRVVVRIFQPADIGREQRLAALVDAEKDGRALAGQFFQQARAHPADILALAGAGFRQHEGLQPPHRHEEACRRRKLLGDPRIVGAAITGAVEWIIGEDIRIFRQAHRRFRFGIVEIRVAQTGTAQASAQSCD